MSTRRLGGYALCISAVISLLIALWYNLGGDSNIGISAMSLLGGVLFIAGLPAIQWTQPQTGRAGQVGLALMAIGALIAIGVNAYSVAGASDVDEIVPLASAVIGLAGDLLVGWLTTRAGVFPAWVGWLLMLAGALNFAGGFLPEGALATTVGLISAVAMPLAAIGFGISIVRVPAIAAGEQT